MGEFPTNTNEEPSFTGPLGLTGPDSGEAYSLTSSLSPREPVQGSQPRYGDDNSLPPYTALGVADAIRFLVTNCAERITHQRLHHMLYLAQAWHLALRGKVLFRDEIEAWPHGPCIPQVFEEFRKYGYSEIPEFSAVAPSPPDYLIAFLVDVFQAYGHLTPYSLMALAQQDDAWRKARGQLKPTERGGAVISVDEMKKYYEAKAASA
jgi:uncharacterized phage-associated protein